MVCLSFISLLSMKENMKQLKQYIYKVLGTEIQPEPTDKEQLNSLPMYISETYRLYNFVLFNQFLLVVEPKQVDSFSILQTVKHFDLLRRTFAKKVILLLPEITAVNRKRLIGKGINFIVPGKQIYIPELLLDLSENFSNPKTKRTTKKLLPSAQFLLIYHIIHRNDKWQIEEHSFKDIAIKTGYSAMAITKAVNNLKSHEMIEIIGEKEKHIRFVSDRYELWSHAERRNLLLNPVLKQVYVDNKTTNFRLLSNASALSEYSDMNPSRQKFYALEKKMFYGLQKNNLLSNANDYEGEYCIEIWKYNPETLVGEQASNAPVVDPLSLYLSLKESKDERIEMALEQLIDKVVW